jgi:hypothetical protein
MASIVSTISTDRRIQLGAEDFVRQMSFGAKWTKLRISLRLSINGTSNITKPTLFIGVCAGLTNTFKSTATDFCYGIRTPGVNAGVIQDYNYNAGPPAWYQTSSSIGFDACSRTGNTTTTIAPGTSQTCYIASTANNPPSHFSVDILRTGNTYTMPAFNQPGSQGNVQAGQTLRQLLVGQDGEVGTQASWVNNTNKTSFTSAATDSHLCDCVCISWDQSSPTIEISDIQVIRFI